MGKEYNNNTIDNKFKKIEVLTTIKNFENASKSVNSHKNHASSSNLICFKYKIRYFCRQVYDKKLFFF